MHNELKTLDRIADKAWNLMMNGSELDARTVYGEEGKNYIDWCKKADASAAYRTAHDLVGRRGY
jgi:hypothetical protein